MSFPSLHGGGSRVHIKARRSLEGMAHGRSAVGLILQLFSVLVVVEVSDGDWSRNEGLRSPQAREPVTPIDSLRIHDRVPFRASHKLPSYCNCIVSKGALGEN